MSSFSRNDASFSSSSPSSFKPYFKTKPKSKPKSKSRSTRSLSNSKSSAKSLPSLSKSRSNKLWSIAASKMLSRKKSMFPVVLPFNAVPKSFDKIKENCNLISSWWKGVHPEQFPDDCDIDCKKRSLSELARKAGIKPIGEGSYGAVFAACKDDNCNDYILKIQTAGPDFTREVYALTELNGWEFSPQIYDAWTCDGIGFMVIENMGSISSCLPPDTTKAEITRQLDVMLSELHEKDWVHVDTHSGNIMCKNGHIALIDFGWAVRFPKSRFHTVDVGHPLSKRIVGDVLYTKKYLMAAENENKLKAVNAIYNAIRLNQDTMQPLKGLHRMSQRMKQLYSTNS